MRSLWKALDRIQVGKKNHHILLIKEPSHPSPKGDLLVITLSSNIWVILASDLSTRKVIFKGPGGEFQTESQS